MNESENERSIIANYAPVYYYNFQDFSCSLADKISSTRARALARPPALKSKRNVDDARAFKQWHYNLFRAYVAA